ncbi:MAG: major facilitator superfamily [Candidatus Levybacteria bacterium GW2011_GWB1_35_5]|nr:MAG: major facilitator superfamily [Candidatus Levybacteria bacterium GW2011_GWB1_35_5]
MKEINKIYLVHFLAGLTNVASVTFTLYFLSHGLQQFQIAQFFGIFMITMAIFNIPTGAIADIFGHKLSVFLGLVLQSISFFLFFAYPNYFGILLGFLASGLGLAFQSGAISSLIYEILRKENLHENFQKVVGRAGGYMLIAGIIASPVGSFIYKTNPSLPYFLSFLFFVIAAAVTFFVKWEFTKKSSSVGQYFNVITSGIKLTIKNKILLSIVIIGSVLTLSRLLFNQNILQPYQLNIGIDVSYIGVTAAVIYAVQAFISFNAYKFYQKFGRPLSVLVIVFLPAICAMILSLINNFLSLSFIILFYVGHGFRDPIFSHITQEEVVSDKRSTMASTIGFLTSIIAGFLLPVWGKGIDLFGIPSILFLLGIFTFIFGGLGLIILESKKINPRF